MKRTTNRPAASEVTPESLYLNRRTWLKATAGAAIYGSLSAASALRPSAASASITIGNDIKTSKYRVDEELTSIDDATSYNNFYEFGTDKSDPQRHAHQLTTDPWQISVGGEAENVQTIEIDDLVKLAPLENRIYRFRCVEAWSMVIPWIGIPLAAVLEHVKPTSRAKYVAFETVYRPSEMPGQRSRQLLDWPYVEGLRLDEALHPLTFLAVGMYGKALPKQNGAPVRLVVPWKYGFKSIKSIVKITLTNSEPPTTWNQMAPNEYGFYSNVNPNVDHPRWSQKTERRIGDFFRRETLMFNGYESEVANLYKGMDLKKHF